MSEAAEVASLVVSDLRPAPGDTVRAFAAWNGGWPAEFGWSGVTEEQGLEARVVAAAPGPLEVRAGDATIVLEVQPAANHGLTVVHPDVRSLPRIEADSCRDDRYPALAGAWVAACSSSGRVDRATPVEGGAEVALSAGAIAPGLGPGALLAPLLGLWRLPDAAPAEGLVRFAADTIGPPATDGVHAALAWADHVEAFALDQRARTRTDAKPLPWYPAALAWPWAAWVEDGGPTREDVWARGEDAVRVPVARSDRSERHVAGSGRWLAWVDEAGVYVEDRERRERRVYAADTGFAYGLGMWGPVACWEDRAALRAGTGDIDLACSDGVELKRPGNQRAPSRWGPWLLFREANRVMLATAPELMLDDDDPRASQGGRTVAGGWRGAHRDAPVSWTFEWPANGWRVERWDGAAWEPGEPLTVGTVTVTSAFGDAVRLRPEVP